MRLILTHSLVPGQAARAADVRVCHTGPAGGDHGGWLASLLTRDLT